MAGVKILGLADQVNGGSLVPALRKFFGRARENDRVLDKDHLAPGAGYPGVGEDAGNGEAEVAAGDPALRLDAEIDCPDLLHGDPAMRALADADAFGAAVRPHHEQRFAVQEYGLVAERAREERRDPCVIPAVPAGVRRRAVHARADPQKVMKLPQEAV
ncbi:hypothetical protein D3C83_19220 [compost metagenome]